jgi:hypothetical protein
VHQRQKRLGAGVLSSLQKVGAHQRPVHQAGHRNRSRSGVSKSGGRRTSLPTRADSSPLLSTSTADSSEGNQALSHASTKPTLEAASKWNSPLTRFSKMAVPLPNSLT